MNLLNLSQQNIGETKTEIYLEIGENIWNISFIDEG